MQRESAQPIEIEMEDILPQNKDLQRKKKLEYGPEILSQPQQEKTKHRAEHSAKTAQKDFGISPRGIPYVLRSCQHCTLQQLIEGALDMFVCATCQGMTRVAPEYEVVRCGRCDLLLCVKGRKEKQLVKCSQCMACNKIPKRQNR